MERIGQIATAATAAAEQPAQTGLKKPSESLLNTQRRQNFGVSAEQVNAMIAVLNKRWISQGWRAMEIKDSEPMALVWIEALNYSGVPYEHYAELYRMSVQLRATRLAQGLKCDDFSVDTMIACWSTLRHDLRDREIKAGRTLTGYAQSQCLNCYGTGIEIIMSDGYVSARPGCTHENIDPSERDTKGMEIVDQALRQAMPDDTAIDIIKRLRSWLAQDFVRAESDEQGRKAWAAQKILTHAERYCRANEK